MNKKEFEELMINWTDEKEKNDKLDNILIK